MSSSSDNKHEQQSREFFPALDDRALKLSEEQKTFLRHTIRDIPAGTVDLDTEIAKRLTAIQRRQVVYGVILFSSSPSRAYQIYPYKCIRRFLHASLRISEHAAFARILEASKVTDPGILLDIGCCLGTDLRYLVHSGYDPSSVIGCDLHQAFIDLGYELYGDRETCFIPFFAGDVFDIVPCPFPPQTDNTPSPSLHDVTHLNDLRGRVKYVYAGSLFHLFDESKQEAIARRLATLLKVTPGSGPTLVFGRHLGRSMEGLVNDGGQTRYIDSPVSWERLWRRIVGETRRVHVDTFLRPDPSETNEMGPMWWSIWIDDQTTPLESSTPGQSETDV